MIKFLIIALIIITLFVFFVPVQQYIIMHEYTHQIINERHGADSNTVIGFGFGYNHITEPYDSPEAREKAIELNLMNEIISYNVSHLLIWIAFILTIGFSWIIFFMFLIYKQIRVNSKTVWGLG